MTFEQLYLSSNVKLYADVIRDKIYYNEKALQSYMKTARQLLKLMKWNVRHIIIFGRTRIFLLDNE